MSIGGIDMNDETRGRIRKLRQKYNIPTAKKGGPLFKSSGEREYVACISHCLDIIALGYKYAADILVEELGKEMGQGKQDYLVYPIVYCYRLYLELRLKEIIQIGGYDYPKEHDLLCLWHKALPIMQRSSQFFDTEELVAVEEKLKEIMDIDTNSEAFRYPSDKKGKPTLQGIREIDLENLKQVIDSIATPLEGSSTALYEDQKYENNNE